MIAIQKRNLELHTKHTQLGALSTPSTQVQKYTPSSPHQRAADSDGARQNCGATAQSPKSQKKKTIPQTSSELGSRLRSKTESHLQIPREIIIFFIIFSSLFLGGCLASGKDHHLIIISCLPGFKGKVGLHSYRPTSHFMSFIGVISLNPKP